MILSSEIGEKIYHAAMGKFRCYESVDSLNKGEYGLLVFEPESRKVCYASLMDVVGSDCDPYGMVNFCRYHKYLVPGDHTMVMRYGKIIAETVRDEKRKVQTKVFDETGLWYTLKECADGTYEEI